MIIIIIIITITTSETDSVRKIDRHNIDTTT